MLVVRSCSASVVSGAAFPEDAASVAAVEEGGASEKLPSSGSSSMSGTVDEPTIMSISSVLGISAFGELLNDDGIVTGVSVGLSEGPFCEYSVGSILEV